MFYGSDTHAEPAAAVFSIIGSCRLHRLDRYRSCRHHSRHSESQRRSRLRYPTASARSSVAIAETAPARVRDPCSGY